MTVDADARRAARKAAFFHEAMEPAGSSSPHRARSMRIALLILGQARTLSDSLVAQSQRHFLLAPLAAQGSVDVLAVVSSRDDEALLHANYPNATIRTHEVHCTWEQYERYTIGLQMLIAAEASSGHPFDWVVRTRPDLLFYSRLSTPLASLDARAVHCRMRCSSFESTGGEFDLKPSASSNTSQLYHGTITASLGARYKSYCANVGRTYVINPNKGQEKHYKLLLEVQQEAINALKVGQPLSAAYEAALNRLKSKAAHLEKKLTKIEKRRQKMNPENFSKKKKARPNLPGM